jgi:stage II sporulation protein D
VRSYTASNIGAKFSSYGFDLANNAESQVYRGRHQITNRVIQAVAETKDMILVCDGKMARGYYSSSQGGWTVDTKYVWGGYEGPYIVTQPTPWEKYANVTNGFWNIEVTQKELLEGFGIYNSGDKVKDISLEFAGDSTYVYKMSVTDSKGQVATKTRCSKVVGVMNNFGAKSANFLIGKGSLEYTYDKVISTKIISLESSYAENMSIYTANGVAVENSKKFNFFTALGQAFSNLSSSLYVHTGNGTAILTQNIEIPTTSKPDANGKYTYVCDYGDFLIVTDLQQVTETFKASSSSNYVVVGRGWGHGVGVSQYGTAHLGQAGAMYHHILAAYYPNTEIANFFDYLK